MRVNLVMGVFLLPVSKDLGDRKVLSDFSGS